MSKTYTYNDGANNGTVMSIVNNKDTTRTQTFTYDQLNRLSSASDNGHWGNTYVYDAWGSLLQKAALGSKPLGETFGVSADAQNRLHVTAGADYQYDAAGNMTYNASGMYYSYDQENRITGAGGYTYVYDADGNRVEKTTGGSSPSGTLYWYMSAGIVGESDLSGTLQSEYVFFDGERVARVDLPGNTLHYYLSDHLQSTSMLVSASGIVENESDYYPWGGERQITNTVSNHYKFTGKERDSESGLDYFGKRYYSSGLGRWTSPDHPFADQHRIDPQSWNIYAYARNNPLRYIDDNGLEVIESKEIKYYTVTGKTAQQAVDQARNHFGKNVAGLTSFRMQVVNPQQKVGAAPKADGGFTGKAELTKADVKLDQTVELPKWTSSNPTEQAAFDHVVDILQKHEDEHVDINHQEADKLDKSLPGTTGTGEGQTGQEAAQNAYNDMFGKASQKQHDAKAEADKKNEDLDKKTNHGTKDQQ
jgi:RHS repeat-associated protein